MTTSVWDASGVGKHLVDDEQLHQAIDTQDSRQAAQHRKTRMWMVVLTAPSWGALLGGLVGAPHLAAVMTAAAGVSVALISKFHIFLS